MAEQAQAIETPVPAPAQAPEAVASAQTPPPEKSAPVEEAQPPKAQEHEGLHAALREERQRRRALAKEREEMTAQMAELRAEARLLREMREQAAKKEEPDFLRENREDPLVKELLSTRAGVDELKQSLEEIRAQRAAEEKARADSWANQAFERVEKSFSDLAKIDGLNDVFAKDEDGNYINDKMLDFIDLASSKNITDDKSFDALFKGFFHDHLVEMVAQARMAEQEKLKQEAGQASTTVGAPGVTAGSNIAFGASGDFVKRVQEMLRSRGQ